MTSWLRKLSLRTVLIVPFVLQTVTAVGLVGYLSYKNGQQAVEDLVKQLMEEVGERISDRLDSNLETPQQVVTTNHLAWQQGTLDIRNLEEVRQQLWQQIKLNPSMTGIFFLNRNGETVGYGRILSQDMREVVRKVSGKDLPIGTIFYSEAKNPATTQRKFYTTDSRGKPQKLVYMVKMDFRTLPWYVQAKSSRKKTWTPLVVYQAAPAVGMFAVTPVYDRLGQLQAVFAANVDLAALSTFLKKLHFSRSGQAFIIDSSGNLAATSTLEKPYVQQANNRPTPLSIFNSRNVRHREIAEHLKKRFGNFRHIQNNEQLIINSQGEKLFIRIVPYRDKYSFNFSIVVAIPESDFMAQINENTRQTILLCIVTLLVTIGMGAIATHSITKPILHLNAAAKNLSKGELEGNIPVTGAKEVSELTESFNQMAQVLLEYNRSLETQVQERTEAWQRSEAQMNAFIAAAPVGMGILNKNLRFVKLNQVLSGIAGLTVEEKIGKTIREVVPQKLADTIEPLYQQVLATGKPIINLEIRGEVPTKQGIQGYWMVSYFPIFDVNNSPDGVGVVVVDITERKYLEIAFQEKTDELEQFFSAPLDLLCIADTDGYFRRLNVEWEKVLGYTLADLEGCRFLDFVHPDDLESTLGAIAELSQQQVVLNFTNRYRHRDGSYRWIEWRSLPIGKLIYAAARDITERKRAEAELLESKRLIEQVTESTSAILYIFDLLEQRNVYINSQIERLLGYSPAEIQAMGSNVFSILMHPEDLPRVIKVHAGLPLLSDNDWMEVEYRMRDKQGNWHWLCSHDRILTRTASGQPAQLLGTATDITVRKQTEAALRQSEERFQEIAQTIDQLFFVRSVSTGEFLYVNPAYERIWGRSCESLYRDPQSWEAAIHREDRSALQSSLRIQFEGKSVKRGYRIIRPDGEIRWIQAEISVIYDRSGKPQRFIGFAEDVTDRKLAEIALRESEHKFSTIFHSSPDPLWIATLSEGRCLNVNDSFAKFLEYPYEEIIGKTCVELKLWDKIEDLHRFRQALTKEGKITNFEVVLRTRSRQARTVLLSATVSHINKRDCVIGLLKDITDRKQIEQALAREILRSKTLLDSSVDGIVVLDSQGNVLETNASFARMLGYTIEETLTLNLVDWDADWTRDKIERKITESNLCINTFETRHRRKDGSIYDVEISANNVIFDSKKVIFCICRDITERKNLKRALEASEAKLNDILNTAPAAISRFRVFADGNWEIDYIANGCEALSGYSATEIKADKTLWISSILSEDWQAIESDLFASIFEQRTANREYRLRHKDGSMRWIAETTNSRWDRTEKCWMVTVIAIDITDRKQLQLALQTSEARLKSVLNNAPAFISGVRLRDNDRWEYEYFSPGIEAICGYAGEEIAGDYSLLLSLILPEDMETVVKPALARSFTPNFSTTIEFRLRHKNGSIRWVANSLSTYCDETNQCWYGTGIMIDITDRKLAEQALQQIEFRLQQLAAASPGVIYTVVEYPDGPVRYEYLSPAFEEIHEIPVAEALENPGLTFNQIHPDDRTGYQQAVAKALETMQTFKHEWRIMTPSGKIKWIQANSRPLRRENGQIVWHGIVLDVTDRKRAEAIIQEREARLRLAMEVSNAIAWERNLQTDELLFTSTIKKEIPIRISYTEALEMVHPDDRAKLHRANQEAISQREGFQIEHRVTGSLENPEWRWLQVKAKILTDPAGNPTTLIGMSVDITDRKQTEQALRESESALIAAQKIAHLGNWSFDIVTQKITWSEETFYIFGLDPRQGEPTYDRLLQFTHPQDLEILQRNIELAFREGKAYEHEIRIIRLDGAIRYTFGKGEPVFNEAGQVIKLFGIVLDITERTQTEETLKITLTRLQNLATAVPGNIYSLVQHSDGSFKFEYCNRAIEEITELTLEEAFQDAKKVMLSLIHPEDLAGYLAAVDRSLETMDIFKHQWRVITPSGQLKWLQGNSQPERRNNGDIVWHGIVLDITDRKLAEAELSQAKEAAEAANRAKSTFLANMSHELRTPLNAVLGFAQLISQSPGLSPQDRENIAIINRSGEHLLTLINDVLDMAKIEAGRMTLNETTFNFYRFLDELERMFYLKAREKKLQLNFDRDASIPEFVRTDEIKLRQVLINLIGNAIKFTEAGHVTVRAMEKIKGRNQTRENEFMDLDNGDTSRLAFEIEDTGVGIPEHELESIFEPFLQTRTGKQSQEGTGLGLPISRKFIQLMGGNITVSSQVGCGSTFYFDIQFGLADRLSELNKQVQLEDNSKIATRENHSLTPIEKAAIKPIDFAVLPKNLIERLEQASIQASWYEITSTIDEIALIDLQLAERLKYLIQMFDYQKIVTAIKLYKYPGEG
ncbi:PAS domain S-box protein [Aerosakkonema funiforme]|uniref:PAS domain S-box protein n=1 Tax=Aerosakkonema funiforme TaxID=1246630 RepID=UPI0035BA18E7